MASYTINSNRIKRFIVNDNPNWQNPVSYSIYCKIENIQQL